MPTVVVEDGSVVANANAYISVADSDAYFDDRGNVAWTEAADDAKASALIRAADFMVQRYRSRWKGVRKSSDQTLDWPRSVVIREEVLDTANYVLPELDQLDSYIIENNVVPEDIRRANAELAVRALASELSPDLTRSDDVKMEKVDVVQVHYKDRARPSPTYQAVEDALRVYFRDPSSVTIRRG